MAARGDDLVPYFAHKGKPLETVLCTSLCERLVADLAEKVKGNMHPRTSLSGSLVYLYFYSSRGTKTMLCDLLR
jgi:hypothetical protein